MSDSGVGDGSATVQLSNGVHEGLDDFGGGFSLDDLVGEDFNLDDFITACLDCNKA